MAQEKVNMPMSGAGILSSGTEDLSKIHIRPTHVVVLVIAVILFVLLMHLLYA